MKKLLLVAVLGFGAFAMAQQNQMPAKKDPQERKAMMDQKRAEHVAQMQKDLNLSQAQTEQLKAIHEKYQAKREQERMQNQALRKQKMEGYKKDKQQMDDEMRKILTPEQYAKWQTKKQENMQKHMQKRNQRVMESSKGHKMQKQGMQGKRMMNRPAVK